MSRLDEIKDEYAESKGANDWKDLWFSDSNYRSANEMVNEVMKLYAAECCQASLEKASENFRKKFYAAPFHLTLAKESITNPENIILL